MKSTILFLTILTTALMAGLFFAWSVSVMPGLKRLGDREFMLSMQAMNRAIQNPIFLSCFMGVLVLSAASCWLQFEKPLPQSYYWLVAASLVYLIGVFGVTIFGNIPLNNALDALDVARENASGLSAFRNNFEAKWNTLNNIRTLASVISVSLLVAMLMKK